MAGIKRPYVTVDEALTVLTSGITAEKVTEAESQSSVISEQIEALESKTSDVGKQLDSLSNETAAIKETLASAFVIKEFETSLTGGTVSSSADEAAGTMTYMIDWPYTGAEMAEAINYAFNNIDNLVSVMAYCAYCSSTNITVNNATGELSTRLFFDLGMNVIDKALEATTPFTWDAFFSISSEHNYSTGARLRYTVPTVYSSLAEALGAELAGKFAVLLRLVSLKL